MFERFKKTIHHIYDVLPQFDYDNCTEDEFEEFLKKLTRIQMLEVGDRISFDEIKNDIDHYAIYYKVMDRHSWYNAEDVNEALNKLYWGKDSISGQVPKLQKQVEGMQKKLDKIETLISNAEFKLCGKDAMKL